MSNLTFQIRVGTLNGVVFQSGISNPLQVVASEFRQVSLSLSEQTTTLPTNLILQIQTADSTKI